MLADDNFKFDKNGKKLSERVENTVGKGEIARYEQFLLFPQCFQKACFPRASKGVIVWEWVKLYSVIVFEKAIQEEGYIQNIEGKLESMLVTRIFSLLHIVFISLI